MDSYRFKKKKNNFHSVFVCVKKGTGKVSIRHLHKIHNKERHGENKVLGFLEIGSHSAAQAGLELTADSAEPLYLGNKLEPPHPAKQEFLTEANSCCHSKET